MHPAALILDHAMLRVKLSGVFDARLAAISVPSSRSHAFFLDADSEAENDNLVVRRTMDMGQLSSTQFLNDIQI